MLFSRWQCKYVYCETKILKICCNNGFSSLIGYKKFWMFRVENDHRKCNHRKKSRNEWINRRHVYVWVGELSIAPKIGDYYWCVCELGRMWIQSLNFNVCHLHDCVCFRCIFFGHCCGYWCIRFCVCVCVVVCYNFHSRQQTLSIRSNFTCFFWANLSVFVRVPQFVVRWSLLLLLLLLCAGIDFDNLIKSLWFFDRCYEIYAMYFNAMNDILHRTSSAFSRENFLANQQTSARSFARGSNIITFSHLIKLNMKVAFLTRVGWEFSMKFISYFVPAAYNWCCSSQPVLLLLFDMANQ